MNPSELWLLEHARALSLSLLVVGALLGALFGPAVRRWRRASALRRVLGRLGAPLAHATDARPREAAVQGTLEGASSDGVLALHRDAAHAHEPPARWRAPGLTLVTSLGRVALEGDVEVRAGHAVTGDGRVGDEPGARFIRATSCACGGVLEGVAGGASHGDSYRDASAAWRLVPGGEGALLAARVDLDEAPVRAASRGASAGLGAMLAMLVLTATGLVGLARIDALRGAEASVGERLVCEGRGARWGVIAALSPLSRRRAIDGLLRTLACREQRGFAEVDAQEHLVTLLGNDATSTCLQRADVLVRGRRFARAAVRYASCGTEQAQEQAGLIWAFLARYDRASALARARLNTATDPAALRLHARWHIAAGDDDAARAALQRAEVLLDQRRVPLRVGREAWYRGGPLNREALRCALAFLAVRGDDEAMRAGVPDCAARLLDRRFRVTCEADARMANLDDGAGAWRSDDALREVGRERLRTNLEGADTRAALQHLRAEEPHLAVDLLVTLVRRGQRSEADRSRLRAFIETEFPQSLPQGYDAGTLRWIAGAIDHPALLAEARDVAARQCAQQRRAATHPALRALSEL
ncbi:MAG: hypothetical protein U0325_02920 [Polyangiales bacterium]